MPFTYSPLYRALVISQIHEGKPVAVVAVKLGLNPATIYRERRRTGSIKVSKRAPARYGTRSTRTGSRYAATRAGGTAAT